MYGRVCPTLLHPRKSLETVQQLSNAGRVGRFGICFPASQFRRLKKPGGNGTVNTSSNLAIATASAAAYFTDAGSINIGVTVHHLHKQFVFIRKLPGI